MRTITVRLTPAETRATLTSIQFVIDVQRRIDPSNPILVHLETSQAKINLEYQHQSLTDARKRA